MSAAAAFPADDFLRTPSSSEDADLTILTRLFGRLSDQSRRLRADAQILGDRVERFGRLAATACDE